MPIVTVDVPTELYERLLRQSKALGKRPRDRVRDILDREVPAFSTPSVEAMERGLATLRALLERIPRVRVLSAKVEQDGNWWVKLDIDIQAPIAWHIVQELGFVLNYIAMTERLPTVFMPISPPPYLNGGPRDFLSWSIESRLPFQNPGSIAQVLEERLPSPIEEVVQWLATDDDSDDDADDDE